MIDCCVPSSVHTGVIFFTLLLFFETMLLLVRVLLNRQEKRKKKEKWIGVRKERKKERKKRKKQDSPFIIITIVYPSNHLGMLLLTPSPSLFLFYFSFLALVALCPLLTINYLGISKATPDQGPFVQATHSHHPQDHRQSTCLQLL